MKNNGLALLLVMLSGLVLGGLVAQVVQNMQALSWLAYGEYFGTNSPVVLDLGVIVLTFGVQFHITIAGIIGMFVATFLYLKMTKIL